MKPIHNFTVPGSKHKYTLFAELEPSIIVNEKRRYFSLCRINTIVANEIGYFVQVFGKDNFSFEGKFLCKHQYEKAAFDIAEDWLKTKWDGKL